MAIMALGQRQIGLYSVLYIEVVGKTQKDLSMTSSYLGASSP